MNRRNHICSRHTLVVLAFGLALLAASWPGRAQPSQPVVGGRGFKFTEYYPPQETQLKSLLECGQAQLQPDGRYLITGAKYQTFHETGKGELTVEAPQCVFDSGQRSISSPGSLRVQTADGKFAIEGEGFLWQQTNSTLLVSNRVHTTLHPELLGRQSTNATVEAPAAQGPGIEIFSDQFEYGQNTGLGIYQGNVRVAGTNLSSTAGKLTILLPAAERRLQSLTAEQNVVVDYEKIHATAERAFYSADTDLIQLTGQPTWRIEQRDGSGDELVFDRTNKVFRANGHARLKLPAQSMGASGFLSQPGSASAKTLPATNHFVEILCRQLRDPHQPGGLSRGGAGQRPPWRSAGRGNELRTADAHLCRHQRAAEDGGRAPGRHRAGGQAIHGGEGRIHRHQRLAGIDRKPHLAGRPARRAGRLDAGQPGAGGNAGARKRADEIAGGRDRPVRFQRPGHAETEPNEGQHQ